MCRVFDVHPGGYYAWLESPMSARAKDNVRVLGLVKQCWPESGGVYGYRKITAVKTVDQKARLSWHPVREGYKTENLQARRALAKKATPEQIGINQLATRMPFGKLLVAIANKHARQIWAILARGDAYDPEAWIKHPMAQRNALRKNAWAVAA